jgi:hypothetical protein
MQQEVQDLQRRLAPLEVSADRLAQGQFACCFVDMTAMDVFRTEERQLQFIADIGRDHTYQATLRDINKYVDEFGSDDEKARWTDILTGLKARNVDQASRFLNDMKLNRVSVGHPIRKPDGTPYSQADLEKLRPNNPGLHALWKSFVETHARLCQKHHYANNDLLYKLF